MKLDLLNHWINFKAVNPDPTRNYIELFQEFLIAYQYALTTK